jgi:hypothetical protein
MAEDDDRVRHLRGEVDRLGKEVERYRTASEDALQQLDWCIGYFVGSNKNALAKSLGRNRAYIRKHLMKRDEVATPTDESGSRRNE